MSRFGEESVVIRGCTVVWDGMTRPEQANDGSIRYTLKVVAEPNNPDVAEFYKLSQEALQKSKFRGQLPQGGMMPIGTAGPNEFGGMFPGYAVINSKTKFMPNVHAENLDILDPMQWAPYMYPGQKVNVLLNCYEYDSHGNRGIGAGLQGVQIIQSAQAPRLPFGSGGPDTSSAFGGNAPKQQPQGGGGPGPGYQAPQATGGWQGQQQPQGGYQQPTPGYPPQGGYQPPGQPAYGQPPAQGGYQPPTTGQPPQGYGQPPATNTPPAQQNWQQSQQPAQGQGQAQAPQQQSFIPPGQ